MSSQSNDERVYKDPWSESLYNCTTGANYLRSGEYIRLIDHLEKQQCEVERLRSALVKAVECIQVWHNQGIPVRECSKLWDIYWRNSPEMKPIREALTALRETPRG